MTDESGARTAESVWTSKFTLLLTGALITFMLSVVATVIYATGGRIVAGGETSAVLTAQVSQIVDQNRVQDSLLRQILGQQYTRDEARADREAVERRFQSMELRLSELGRRIEAVEMIQRAFNSGGRRP